MSSSAVAAVDARRLTSRALADLSDTFRAESRVRVVVAGKAAAGAARAVDEDPVVRPRLVAGVMTAAVDNAPGPAWRTFAAAHPRPNEGSDEAARAALALADACRQDGDLLLVCLSGGASAMFETPAEGLALDDVRAAGDRLLESGVDIAGFNLVRRHLSAVKGGQLAARAGRSVTLAISDVSGPVEDDPAVIGSGPTVAGETRFEAAIDVIMRHGLAEAMPPAVIAYLQAGVAGHVSGPVPVNDPRLAGAAYWIIGSRRDAMRAAAETAARMGYHVHVEPASVAGEAREAGPRLVSIAARLPRPACLIASGETTVRVVGRGRGGRNQELALAAIEPLAALAPAALASVGTDGVDGPTDAAGAFVDSDTWTDLGPTAADRLARALADNDAYPVLDSLGALVRTGPTGTNVGDLQIVLLGQKKDDTASPRA
jgi:hydroxypyruvate reductase